MMNIDAQFVSSQEAYPNLVIINIIVVVVVAINLRPNIVLFLAIESTIAIFLINTVQG